MLDSFYVYYSLENNLAIITNERTPPILFDETLSSWQLYSICSTNEQAQIDAAKCQSYIDRILISI